MTSIVYTNTFDRLASLGSDLGSCSMTELQSRMAQVLAIDVSGPEAFSFPAGAIKCSILFRIANHVDHFNKTLSGIAQEVANALDIDDDRAYEIAARQMD